MSWPVERQWRVVGPGVGAALLRTPDLAGYRALVLLGAAGMGKTFELDVLRSVEQLAGFSVESLNLGQLSGDGSQLRSVLDRFTKDSYRNGVLHLDSLDEAMVPLRTVAAVLEGWLQAQAASPIRFRIACRSAVWPAVLDRALAAAYGEEGFVIALLQPLDSRDIQVVALAEGTDGARFRTSVERVGLHSMAALPLTLKLLLRAFRENADLPSTRMGLLDSAVQRLCTEPADRRERGTAREFSGQPAIEAAERLAFHCMFSGRPIIDMGDDEPTATDALHHAMLASMPAPPGAPRLDDSVLRDLAATGLFEWERSRRFRFVHRQVAEYLAGRRLASLPTHQARALLSTQVDGRTRVAGPLRETAAIAASLQPELAQWVCCTDPEVVGLSEIADEGLRRTALLAVAEDFRVGRLTDAQVLREAVAVDGLGYAGIDEDVGPMLRERGEGLDDLRSFAIHVAGKLRLVGLVPDLANLALDEATPIQTRTDAARALEDISPEQIPRRLRALAAGAEGDANDDLKGLVLRSCWPESLSTTELLAVLHEPRKQHYVGAYQLFLAELESEGFDAGGHSEAGLRWALSLSDSDDLPDALETTVGRVAFRALDDISRPGVRRLLARLLLKHSMSRHCLFCPRPPEKGRKGTADDDFVRARFTQDGNLRRLLLDEVVKAAPTPVDTFLSTWSVPGLLNVQDFPWLLVRAVDTRRKRREFYAELASRLPWWDVAECVEMWLRLREREPIKTVLNAPLSVELDSDAAKEMRGTYQLQQGRAARPVSKLEPPPDERVRLVLGWCKKMPEQFARLAREMTLTEDATSYKFERFLDRTPGWQSTAESTRAEIVGAAKVLITRCLSLATRINRTPFSTIRGDGVMPALFLLVREEAAWLESRSASWWRSWIWYVIRELHPGLGDEPQAPKGALLKLLHRKLPRALRTCLRRMARAKKAGLTLTGTLELLEDTSDPNLDRLFCSLVRDPAVHGEALEAVMRAALARCPEPGFEACLRRLSPRARSGAAVPAVLACVALLRDELTLAFGPVLAYLVKRPDLAAHVLGRWAHEDRKKRDLGELNPDQLAELLKLLWREFPPDEDPRPEGGFFAGPVDSGRRLRDRVTELLVQSGSQQAVTTFRALEKRLIPAMPWLRRVRAEAERRLLETQVNAVDPSQLARILADSEARVLSSSDEVVEAILAALQDYEIGLQRKSPRQIEELWNTSPRSKPCPKDEEWISDKVCLAVRQHLERCGVTVGREVQLRRRVVSKAAGGQPGQRTDVLVSVPTTGTKRQPPITVVLEMKRSSNPEARSGLRGQLVDGYLVPNSLTHGLFVVAYLDAPGLGSSHRPQWKDIEQARRDVAEQAAAVNSHPDLCVSVRSFVLDARLDGMRHSRGTRARNQSGTKSHASVSRKRTR